MSDECDHGRHHDAAEDVAAELADEFVVFQLQLIPLLQPAFEPMLPGDWPRQRRHS
jgi:hypothetical protein